MTRLIVLSLLLPWCLALSVIDLRTLRLPNALTLPGAVVLISAGALLGKGSAALVGAVLLGACYLLVYMCSPGAMGGGDVKLALGLGAAAATVGAANWVWTALAAPVCTAMAGLAVLSRRRARAPDRARTVVPHGPSMCLAALGAVAII